MSAPWTDRLSWSSATHPRTSLPDELAIAERLGLAGLGVTLPKVEASGWTDERVREELSRRNLRATFCAPGAFSILPLPGAFAGSRTFADATADRSTADRVRLICDAMPRLAEFDPVAIVVAPGNSGDPARPAGPIEEVADGLARIADAAAAQGLRIAFELIGERRGSPLFTLPQIVEFVDTVGRDNVGIHLDVFHSWPEPDLHEHLTRYADRIVNVDLNDVRVDERSGFDREFPGGGRGVAPAIIRTLLAAGYEGWWNLEVFSDDGTFGHDFPDSSWKWPVDRFADHLHASAVAAFATAGAPGPEAG